MSVAPDQNNLIAVNVKGTLYGFLFNEKELARKMAENVVDKYGGEEVYVPNIRDLTFSLADRENISFADVKDIKFTLLGTPKIIWKVDEDELVADLLDKKKKDLNQILLRYPSVDSAALVLRPFWKTSFPAESEKIEIVVNYPK